jgi:putative FmdB family regulatory protein
MACETHFDELVRSADQAVVCPECGAAKVLKQFSTFAVHGAAKPSSTPSHAGPSRSGGGCCGGACGCGH